ncbi:transcriptional regulator [Chelonobacter oris]|uniref:winged helix-turn-helix transcriptional regulator n=1 Tax=Chelonobacter oris TaxID=505317 RepID=UPI00244BE023|nr:helix-turn-helix domain-containing protein [Chelonobacter oris]MDH3000301.1 transcriptional regulator [Chelonobacter oris]
MEKNTQAPFVRGYVLSAQCPSRPILQHLTSRWGVLVMLVLLNGTKRFSELRNTIDGVSERMLTQTLQQLGQDGMLIRKSFHTVPPHVEYTLTAHGAAAAEKLKKLVDWLEESLPDILTTQEQAAIPPVQRAD